MANKREVALKILLENLARVEDGSFRYEGGNGDYIDCGSEVFDILINAMVEFKNTGENG